MKISEKYKKTDPKHLGIKFNGERIGYVQEADEEEGWIERYKLGSDKKVILENGVPKLFREFGDVKVVII